MYMWQQVMALRAQGFHVKQIARKAGKIRFAGVSTHSAEMVPFLARNPNVEVVLAQYNFSTAPSMGEAGFPAW